MCNTDAADELYDSNILNKLSLDIPVETKDYRVRALRKSDFNNGFLQVLSEMTVVGDIPEEQFNKQYVQMQACQDVYYVTVLEDKVTSTVLGAATLFLEHKFIRGCAKRGRLEDVVITDAARGKSYGKLMVTVMRELAKHLGCYKITLDCKDELIPYYEASGFQQEAGNANSMSIRF